MKIQSSGKGKVNISGRWQKIAQSSDIEAEMIAQDLWDWWKESGVESFGMTQPESNLSDLLYSDNAIRQMMIMAPQKMNEYTSSSYELTGVADPGSQWGPDESRRLQAIEKELHNIVDKARWDNLQS